MTRWRTHAGPVGNVMSFSDFLGDGVATEFTVTHNLSNLGVTVSVQEVATGEFVVPQILRLNSNQVKIVFGSAPTTNQYLVTVQG